MKKHLKAKTVKNMALALSVAVASSNVIPAMATESEIDVTNEIFSDEFENVQEDEILEYATPEEDEALEENIERMPSTRAITTTPDVLTGITTISISSEDDFQEAVTYLRTASDGEYVLSFTENINLISTSATITELRDFNTSNNLKITFTSADTSRPITITSSVSIELPRNTKTCEFIIKNLNFSFTNGSESYRRIYVNANKLTMEDCDLKGTAGNGATLVGGFNNISVSGKTNIDITLRDVINARDIQICSIGSSANNNFDEVNLTLGGNVTLVNNSNGINIGGYGSTPTSGSVNQLNITIEKDANVNAGTLGTENNSGGILGTTHNYFVPSSFPISRVNFDIKGTLSGLGDNNIAENATITGFIDLSKVTDLRSDLFSGRTLDGLELYLPNGNDYSDKIEKVLSGVNAESLVEFKVEGTSDTGVFDKINELIGTDIGAIITDVAGKKIDFKNLIESHIMPTSTTALVDYTLVGYTSIDTDKIIEFIEKNTNKESRFIIDVTEANNDSIGGFTGKILGEKLAGLKLSEKLKTIENDAFYYADLGNKQLEIPSSVTTIGERAFARSGLSILFKGIENLETIGADAFTGVTITFEGESETLDLSNCREIGSRAFSGATIGDKVIKVSSSLSKAGDRAFYEQTITTDENGVMLRKDILDTNAFYGATLQDFTFKNNITLSDIDFLRDVLKNVSEGSNVIVRVDPANRNAKSIEDEIKAIDASNGNVTIEIKPEADGLNPSYESIDTFYDKDGFYYTKNTSDTVTLVNYVANLKEEAYARNNFVLDDNDTEINIDTVIYEDPISDINIKITQLGDGETANIFSGTKIGELLKDLNKNTTFNFVNVVTIGKSAFKGADINNSTLNFTSATTIGESAFENATITNSTIELSAIKTIESGAFSNINANAKENTGLTLKLITIPDIFEEGVFVNSRLTIDLTEDNNSEDLSDFTEEKVVTPTEAEKLINAIISENEIQNLTEAKVNIIVKDTGSTDTRKNSARNIIDAIRNADAYNYITVNGEKIESYKSLAGKYFKDQNDLVYKNISDKSEEAAIIGFVDGNIEINTEANTSAPFTTSGTNITISQVTFDYGTSTKNENATVKITQIGDGETNGDWSNLGNKTLLFPNVSIVSTNAFKDLEQESLTVSLSQELETIKENAFSGIAEDKNFTLNLSAIPQTIEDNAFAGSSFTISLVSNDNISYADLNNLVESIGKSDKCSIDIIALNNTNTIKNLKKAIRDSELTEKITINGEKISANTSFKELEVGDIFTDANHFVYEKLNDDEVALVGYDESSNKSNATPEFDINDTTITVYDLSKVTYRGEEDTQVTITQLKKDNSLSSISKSELILEGKTLSFPNVTLVEEGFFEGIEDNDVTISFGQKLTTIEANAFEGITGENFTVKFEQLPTSVDFYAFSDSSFTLDLEDIDFSLSDGKNNYSIFEAQFIPVIERSAEKIIHLLVAKEYENTILDLLEKHNLVDEYISINGKNLGEREISVEFSLSNGSSIIDVVTTLIVKYNNLNREGLLSAITKELSGTEYESYEIEIYTNKGKTEVLQNTDTLDENFTYYVVLKQKAFIVTFDPQGGSFSSGFDGKSTTNEQGTLIRPENSTPEKSGYTFAGWYQDAQYKKEFIFYGENNPTIVKENITLYAKWEEEKTDQENNNNVNTTPTPSVPSGSGGGGGGGSTSASSSSTTTQETTQEETTQEEMTQEIIIQEETTQEVEESTQEETIQEVEVTETKELNKEVISLPEINEEKVVNFTDVEETHWASSTIEKLAQAGILSGDENGEFNPTGNSKRADVTIMLVKLLGLEGETPTTNFNDVSADKYYANYVGIAKEYGIVNGSNGNFNPEETISRQDTMVMTANILKALGIEANNDTSALEGYKDFSSISSYAQESVAILVNAGIITGSNGNINPKADVTRAEMSVIVAKLYDLLGANLNK